MEREAQTQMLYMQKKEEEELRRKEAEEMIRLLAEEEQNLIARLRQTQNLQQEVSKC